MSGESWNRRTRWASLAVVTTLLAVAMWAAAPTAGGGVHAADRDVAAQERPECPHTPQFVIVDSVEHEEDDDDDDGDEVVVTQTVLEEVPLSGPISDVPEYHDCQRFIVDSAGQDVYGSLYAIFARNRLWAFDSLVGKYQDSSAFPALHDSIVAVPAATIYAYGETYDPGRYDHGAYAQLHLQPGFNCLYLYRELPAIDWRAWMLSRGLNDPHCPDSMVMPNPAAAELSVGVFAPVSPLTAVDIPSVARWDWDSAGREQYIGIRCGNAWCEVSDDGLRSQQPALAGQAPVASGLQPPVFDQERTRVTAIKGWYDAQRLAERDLEGKLKPSNAFGYVIPNPALHRYIVRDFMNRWVPVATAIVRNADYEGSLMTMKKDRPYQLHLCAGMCIRAGTPRPTCDLPSHAGLMWGMITFRNDAGRPDTVYHCVARRVPGESPRPIVPGTARWRWLAIDETSWKRCADGCCEVM